MKSFITMLILSYFPTILALNLPTDSGPEVPGTWAIIGDQDESFLYQSKSLYFGFEAINEENETFWLA